MLSPGANLPCCWSTRAPALWSVTGPGSGRTPWKQADTPVIRTLPLPPPSLAHSPFHVWSAPSCHVHGGWTPQSHLGCAHSWWCLGNRPWASWGGLSALRASLWVGPEGPTTTVLIMVTEPCVWPLSFSAPLLTLEIRSLRLLSLSL